MNLRLDFRLLGWLLVLVGVFQLLPIGAALWFDEPIVPWFASAAIAIAVGGAIAVQTRGAGTRMRPRDGFFVVGASWVLVSVFGALPYVATGTFGPVDAIFESASGFTTTGSTVLDRPEEALRSMLLWRAFTQWIGGMGIILFAIAILPLLRIGGMQLFQAEVPGPIKNKVRPRLADTARRLWYIYVGLTAAEFAALTLAGLSGYDALCHVFTTMATGGFSTLGTSVGGFQAPLVDWIVIVFMFLAGTNFVLHYQLLSGHPGTVLRDAEFRYFVSLLGIASLLLAAVLLANGETLEKSFRHGVFQAVSIVTTTGYVSDDFERWPELAQVILLILMVPGGMAGSTSGGLKSLRCLLALRALRTTIDRLLHPHAVRTVKYGGETVSESTLSDMWGFFAAYLLITVVATGVVATCGYDLGTSLSAAVTAVGNVGPGLHEISAHDTFSHMPALAKLTLAFCMIAGRLELFTLVVLVLPGFWRR